MEMAQLHSAYLVYKPNTADSTSTKFEHALINAGAIVAVVLVSTFGIVACYKSNCSKVTQLQSDLLMRQFLVLYLMFASSTLLGFAGGLVAYSAIAQYDVHIDTLSFTWIMFNFAITGVVAIFYQKVRSFTNSI